MNDRREKLRKDFLTRYEAAAFAGVCDKTIKRLAQQGRLKKYRQLGRREILYSRAELEQVLHPQLVPA